LAAGAGLSSGGPLSCTTMRTRQESAARLMSTVVRGPGLVSAPARCGRCCRNFVVPQGFNNGWANSGGQEVTFADDTIKQLEGDLCVDTTRVFTVGFSYGAAIRA
jgi:poly(3-hydroxybutyrate) depolymerase